MCLFVGSDLGCKLGFVLLNQNEYEFYKGENLDKYFDNNIDTINTVCMTIIIVVISFTMV